MNIIMHEHKVLWQCIAATNENANFSRQNKKNIHKKSRKWKSKEKKKATMSK